MYGMCNIDGGIFMVYSFRFPITCQKTAPSHRHLLIFIFLCHSPGLSVVGPSGYRTLFRKPSHVWINIIANWYWALFPIISAIKLLGTALRWRHNGHNGVSNHQPHDCLLNRLFRHSSKKHQSSVSLAYVRGIHRWPVNSPHKGPVTRKIFPFDDVIID